MSRAAQASTVSAGALETALLLALTGAAAPHPPRVERAGVAADGNQADGPPTDAAISADGRYVALPSTAPGPGCAQFFACLRGKDLTTGEVTGIDLGPGYAHRSPLLSTDAGRVAFTAGTRFPALLFNARGGLYGHDVRTGAVRRVADGRATVATDDGHRVAVADAGGPRVLDLRTGRSTAAGPAGAGAGKGALAAKGHAMTFSSDAADPVPDDTNGVSDVFVRHIH
ncbi:hypothetical protein [Streptomyces sp. R41]|uniref:Uncharacterized protein n=1 Tax=Streptomyces sp. R41 TaxID=3238632 RepID=A0AB39RNN9_9ACTN